MFILKKGHQPGVYVPLRALFLVFCAFLYPANLKSAGYYVIPFVQIFAFECPSVRPSVRPSFRLSVHPSVSALFNSLPGAFFNQFSSNLV